MVNRMTASNVIQINPAGLKDRAEPPPNPNGGYVEEVIATGKNQLGTRYRTTKLTWLEKYRASGQIGQEQFEAGDRYATDCQILFASGRDSTDQEVRSGGSASRHPLSQAQVDAMRRIHAIDSRLCKNDRHIVHEVCGRDVSARSAVLKVLGEKDFHYAVPRLREALTSLVKATHAAKANGWRQPPSRNIEHLALVDKIATTA